MREKRRWSSELSFPQVLRHNCRMPESGFEKIVYFVRHGQSVDNAAPVFQSDGSPLNDKGTRQAESVAARVSRISFEALIASPLRRAKETAAAIEKATSRKAEYSDLFVERGRPSSVAGKSHVDEQARATWRKWEKSLGTSGMRVENGENYDDLIARADKALEFLVNRTERSLVVVTHGYFLRTIIARVLLGQYLTGEVHNSIQAHARHENAGLTVIRYDGGTLQQPGTWRLWIFNDHAHLG